MNDDELTKLLANHDEQAISSLIRLYTPLTVTIIKNVSNGLLNYHDIEECCSDVFYTVWINAEKIHSGSLKGYLCAVAKTKTKDMLRKLKNVDADDIYELQVKDDFSLLDHIENQQLQDDLKAAFEQFAPQDREILIRHYYYYETAAQIAEKTGLNMEAVKSRIRRAKPKLRSFLRERGYDL